MQFDTNFCCGCGACASVCPCDAISMITAKNGFAYPQKDMTECVECGLCQSVCNFQSFVPTGNDPDCYAVRHKDNEELRTSRSGGFFMAVCKHVIDRGGVVFGCCLSQTLSATHSYAESYEECKKFKGSKYVQSDLGDSFEKCAAFLRSGRWVLFSGTGCQVHGLLSYLVVRKISTDRLITIDLVCHGAPSPGVLSAYLDYFQRREYCKIVAMDFRDKGKNGWMDHIEKYVTADGTIIHTKKWTTIFYRHILFREACYNCKYTTPQRESDFTIADYWGVERNAPEFDDNRGCSLVLVHSSKAHAVLKDVEPYVHLVRTELETSLQPQLKHPVRKGWDYTLFWSAYKREPSKAISTWFFPNKGMQLLWRSERMAKDILKRVLRK